MRDLTCDSPDGNDQITSSEEVPSSMINLLLSPEPCSYSTLNLFRKVEGGVGAERQSPGNTLAKRLVHLEDSITSLSCSVCDLDFGRAMSMPSMSCAVVVGVNCYKDKEKDTVHPSQLRSTLELELTEFSARDQQHPCQSCPEFVLDNALHHCFLPSYSHLRPL